MRVLLTIIASIFFALKCPAQSGNGAAPETNLALLQNGSAGFNKKPGGINTEFNLQEEALIKYIKNKLSIFLLIENILGEIFKPEPAVDKSGYHYRANPNFEIPETKGNTGYIKLGVKINF